ncbi:DUF2834 domain-containing protein [Microseira wollei]|uniref:Membrane protein n=1 Tax=Microseira wollei NIES-4236 TaxID=2530354 RepID=A0AAV3X972_9CYAN|nr:DUF2834 domain-containing protein [Microseira wollei]GET37245.1 putative membrane protein [Microseira wollei NIES-4236]
MANDRTEKYSHKQLASWRLASAVQPTIVITSNLGYYNFQFFANAGWLDFVNESSANLAAKSVSLDLFIATVAGSTWMYLESKRVGIKLGWLYILIGILVAFAFALPLFFFRREIDL